MKFILAHLATIVASVALVDAASVVAKKPKFEFQAYTSKTCAKTKGDAVTIKMAQFEAECAPVSKFTYYKASENGTDTFGCALFYFTDTACDTYGGELTDDGNCDKIQPGSNPPAAVKVLCGG